MKVISGVLRIRQTSISFSVWVSTPLALSMTMIAESTAVRHPIGVFGEVLMAGRVEQVDLEVPVGELHYRGGDRDAAFALDGHPVAGGVPLGLARFDRTGQVDGPAIEQKLFGQSGFPGVGMTDDAEGSAPGYFFVRGGAHYRKMSFAN